MKKSLLLVTLSVCLLPLWGQQNFSRIDSLIKKMLPEASEVGISVYDLTAKKSLYNYRAEKLSRPASTMKLLTAITALSRPEAAEPFRTIVIKRFLSRQIVDGYADLGCFGKHLLDKRIYPGKILLSPKWQQTN